MVFQPAVTGPAGSYAPGTVLDRVHRRWKILRHPFSSTGHAWGERSNGVGADAPEWSDGVGEYKRAALRTAPHHSIALPPRFPAFAP